MLIVSENSINSYSVIPTLFILVSLVLIFMVVTSETQAKTPKLLESE